MPKLTWWFSQYPTDTAARLDDETLIDTLGITRTLCKVLMGDSIMRSEPPVLKMWKFHPLALHVYGSLFFAEAGYKRGYEPSDLPGFTTSARRLESDNLFQMPPWFRDPDVHRSHIAAAWREEVWNPDHELDVEDEDDEFLPLLWPIMVDRESYELKIGKADREALARDDLYLPDDMAKRVVNL